MNRRGGVMVVTDDRVTTTTKTAYWMNRAIRRLGHWGLLRDTSDGRFLLELTRNEGLGNNYSASKDILRSRWSQVVKFSHVSRVLGLDLAWLSEATPFLDLAEVEEIHSIWFDDMRTACTCTRALELGDGFQSSLRHEKVHHHFYGEAQVDEAEVLGLRNVHRSKLACPLEYLEEEHEIKSQRAAFIGNTGFPGGPSREAVEMMEKGQPLRSLREQAMKEMLEMPEVGGWSSAETGVRDFLRDAAEQSLVRNGDSAVRILRELAVNHANPFGWLNDSGKILDAALLVKLVKRYDRPALIKRLADADLVEVFSAPWEWEKYGIQSRPPVSFMNLPEVYGAYAIHLNAASCVREATANEKLFEIAGCGRASLNLRSDDVLECYEEDEEIFVADDLEEAEELCRRLLKDSDWALDCGNRAKDRTEKEHLWDHRLERILGRASG